LPQDGGPSSNDAGPAEKSQFGLSLPIIVFNGIDTGKYPPLNQGLDFLSSFPYHSQCRIDVHRHAGARKHMLALTAHWHAEYDTLHYFDFQPESPSRDTSLWRVEALRYQYCLNFDWSSHGDRIPEMSFSLIHTSIRLALETFTIIMSSAYL
jgi:hypothetical protein